MAVKWTAEQQKVIDTRDRNLLVSAAAGSGKTAVLVERILAMVKDPVRPIDVDQLLLTTIMEKFQGGPVGLDALPASIGEDAGTIEDVYEPFLIKSGFINRTPRGRVATEFAWHHLGLEAPRKIEE